MALDFYDEVRIVPEAGGPAVVELCEVAGRLGAVVGTSTDEHGVVTAYAVAVDGDVVWSVEPGNLVATGSRRDESAYRSGVSIRVSEDGELLDG